LKYKTVDVIVKDIPKDEILHSIITSNFHRKNNCLQTLNIFDSLMGIYSHQGKKTSVTISTEDDKPQIKKGGNVTRDNVCKMMGVSYTNIDRLKKIKDFDIELFKKIDEGKKSINKIYRSIGKTGKVSISTDNIDYSNLNISESNLFKVKKYDEITKMDTIDEGSIQCIVTSPLIYNEKVIDKRQYIDDISNRLIECKTVLTDDGSLFLVMEDTHSGGVMNNIPFKVLTKLIRVGYKHIDTIIWEYSPIPTNGGKRLNSSYRYIFHLTIGLDYHQNTICRNIRRNVITENTNGDTELYDKYSIYKGKKWNSIWYSENIIKTKSSVSDLIPIGLILDSTKEGDTVMNPFDTEESVGLVSLFYDRKFYGVTDDEDYGKKQSDVFHRFLNEYRKVG